MTRRVEAAGRWRHLRTKEDGVILIQVAMVLVILLGFLAMVIDYGVLMVARAQAQDAADGAALAAATALAFDTMATGTGATVAQQNALTVASNTPIWGRTPEVDPAWVCNTVSSTPSTTSCPSIPLLPPLPPRTLFGATVHVYADNAHGNPLPSYFAKAFGVLTQEVRAQATASVAPANVATCVWPLAIPDFWEDNTAPAEDFSRYEYAPAPAGDDAYRGPQACLDGTGTAGDSSPTGIALTTNSTPSDSITNGTEGRLDELLIPSVSPGARWPKIKRTHLVPVRIGGGFSTDLAGCNPRRLYINDRLDLDATATKADALLGASNRWSTDRDARWNAAKYRLEGSCAGRSCAAISPRLVLLPVFDPDIYDLTRNAASPEIRIVNFVGFFLNPSVNPVADDAIIGELSAYPGAIEPGHRFVRLQYSPLRTAVLTR